jgi:molybdopterin converting factor subunit 1
MASSTEKRVSIQYYAVLKEQRGKSEETLTTTAETARDLYEHLRGSHGLSLSADRLRVAINNEFADWDQRLADSDKVVFIPPVAGG